MRNIKKLIRHYLLTKGISAKIFERNYMKSTLVALILSSSLIFGGINYQDLFVSGEDGYNVYRIPSIIVAADDSLLAFCEGRASRSDTGKIDLIMKRSTDGGKTWSEQQVVWTDGANTCGNPCPVVDKQTGRIFLFSTWNLGTDHERDIIARTAKDTRRVFYLTSDDNGLTWSEPVEITKQTKRSDWGWYATGPGIGIQLQYGAHKGRLVIPANHSFDVCADGQVFGAHVIYSDDGGDTWQMSDPIVPGLNESQVVELVDGRLMLNSRNYLYSGTRALAFSNDGGKSWPHLSFQSNLIEPRCQASIIRYSPNKITDKNILLFSNPSHISRRENMMVKLSYNEGKSWDIGKTIHEERAAYSCLVALPDGKIGCFYEIGKDGIAYERIILATFTLDWLVKEECEK